MKCVILAAGKGTRMGELSKEKPKPMQTVLGKTLLQHKLDMLPETISEVIIVVGHLKNKITDHLGAEYRGRKIAYVVQDDLLGTAHALFLCKEKLSGEKKFIVMMGDDIYSSEDMMDMLEGDWAIGVFKVPNVKGKSKVLHDKNGHIKNILEKYENEEKGFTCIGMYVVTPEIFEHEMEMLPNGEFGLPQTILSAAKRISDAQNKKLHVKALESKFWIQITSPEDLEMAELFLSNSRQNRMERVAAGVQINPRG